MGRAGVAHHLGHAGHPHAANHPPEVEQILLHHLHRLVTDEPAEVAQAHLAAARGNRNAECVGSLLPVFVPVGGHGLFEQVNVVGLQQFADADGLRGAVAAVAVGVDGDVVAEGRAHHRNKLFGASGGHFRVAAASANLELHRFSPGLGLQRLNAFQTLFGRPAPVVVGPVNRDLRVVDVADQFAHAFLRNAPQHIQDRHLHRGHRNPQRIALVFVIVLVHKHPIDELIEVPSVFAHEVGVHQHQLDGIQVRHANVMPHAVALGPVGGAHAAQIVALVLQQLAAFDDDGLSKQLFFKHRFRQRGV